MKLEIKTSIDIQASPEKIWNILMNTADYPKWNPFIKSLEGEIKEGQTIQIVLPEMKFKPVILKRDVNKELLWLGKLLVKGLFDGAHRFKIIPLTEDTCRFEHSEEFNGLLVGLFRKKLETNTKSNFITINQALKSLAEE